MQKNAQRPNRCGKETLGTFKKQTVCRSEIQKTVFYREIYIRFLLPYI